MATDGRKAQRVAAIIVAAGASRRMSGVDKVFASLGGKPALSWVMETFQASSVIDDIVLVLAKENVSSGRQMVVKAGWSKVSNVCPGGLRRQDSVREGLHHLAACDIVVVHDGARPCVTSDLIERGVSQASASGAAIAAVPVNDTIKRVDTEATVVETLDRRGLWAIQTPQVFRAELLAEACEKVSDDVTDDAAMIERLGHTVKIYMGSYRNIKITTPEDLLVAEAILSKR